MFRKFRVGKHHICERIACEREREVLVVLATRSLRVSFRTQENCRFIGPNSPKVKNRISKNLRENKKYIYKVCR